MPRVSPLPLVLLLLCLAVPASALKVKDRTVNCPVCLNEFIAYEVIESNFEGGMDPDFFLRALGEPAENYGIWTCPTCYFSALPSAYNDSLPEPKRKTLLGVLDPFRKARPATMPEKPDSQIKIPAWFKWKIAYACYGSGCLPVTEKSEQAYLGDIALRGSWVTRVSGNPIKDTRALRDTYRQVMERFKSRNRDALRKNEGAALCSWYHALGDLMVAELTRDPAADPENRWTALERQVMTLMAGGFYRESGDTARARQFLNQAREVKQDDIRSIAERETELLAIEQEFQRQAIDRFRNALDSGEVKGTAREPLCIYLIGELSRRLGDEAQAREWFQRVKAYPDLRKELSTLVEQQSALLGK